MLPKTVVNEEEQEQEDKEKEGGVMGNVSEEVWSKQETSRAESTYSKTKTEMLC